MNVVCLNGRVGSEIELRKTQNGTSVCQFSLATDEYYKGEKQTEWHSVVAWAHTAEFCAKYLKKGSGANVVGKLKTRDWERNGQKGKKTEVHASSVGFGAGSPPEKKESTSTNSDYDDIPF